MALLNQADAMVQYFVSRTCGPRFRDRGVGLKILSKRLQAP